MPLIWTPLMLTLTLAAPGPQAAGQTQAGFLYKTLTLDGEKYAYAVFVPPEYTPERAWPVILFLHGSGERGDDGFKQTQIGISTMIRRNYRRVPAIVVMPQCRERQAWPGPMSEMALKCVEQTSRDYRLDPQRIYLTGLSLGGQGAWHLAAELPGRFAAVVPVCGFAEWGESTGVAEKLAGRLTDVPIWCYHGTADEAVPVEKTREMARLIKAGGGDIRYTEVPGGPHNVWDVAYADDAMWDWLFQQRLE